MDAQRFDTLARIVASGKPRRDALRVLAGAGVALAVSQALHKDAVACEPFGEYCDPHTPCCSPHVCIYHACQNCIEKNQKTCGGHADCCAKLKCDAGTCVKDDKANCEGNGCGKKKKKKKHKKKH